MPRRKDVPCAGNCGALIWRGKGCLPPGQATCQPCRRAGRGPSGDAFLPRPCVVCGTVFRPSGGGGRKRLCCSRTCAFKHTPHRARVGWRGGAPVLAPCVDCGVVASSRGIPHRCRPCAAERHRANRRRYDSLRRGAKRSRSYPMTIRELGTRDGWRCHLCRRRVSQRLAWPHPDCATFDHLIPIDDGGSEDPENLALAHLSCNSRRGSGGVVQLLLVG